MPKKIATNPKAVEARERKEGQKREKAEKEKKQKEDAEWVETDKHILTKEERKRKDEEKKQAELERKKAARDALAREEQELTKAYAKTQAPKITQAEIARRKQIEELAAKKREEAERKREEEIQENVNRVIQLEKAQAAGAYVEARTVDDAVGNFQALKIGGTPEKRIKVTYASYEERTLPEVRGENPTLKLSQLKELVWKMWQKSPENPANQLS